MAGRGRVLSRPAVSLSVMRRPSPYRLLAGLLGAAALAVGWIFLGPAQLGGGTSYAIIVGSSMEPLLQRGDLALVRESGTYRPGDVVLYESTLLGSKVLHRVERIENQRLVLKGDNNDFVDPERPAETEVIGKLWLHAPVVGKIAGWLRQPLHASLLVGFAVLLALGGGAGLGASRRRKTGARPSRRAAGRPRLAPNELLTLLLGIGAAAALAGILSVVSFTRPQTRLETVDEAYVHQGSFEYSARVPRSPVYADGLVETGEPIFLRLVPRLRIAFDYRLESSFPVDAGGKIALDAKVSDGRGWERQLPLVTERSFTSAAAGVRATLDLARVQTLVDQMRELTGSSQTAFTVALQPRVTVAGRVGAEEIDAAFAPKLSFDLADLRLQPSLGDSGEGVGPFRPREPGSGTKTAAAELSLGPLHLSVTSARYLSLVGLAVFLLLGGLVLGSFASRRRVAEHESIQARHGHLLLPVAALPRAGARVIQIATMDALARLAEHHQRLIFQLVEDDRHVYLVEEGGNLYRYEAGGVRAIDEHVLQDPVQEPDPPPPPDGTPQGALIPGGDGRRYGPRREAVRHVPRGRTSLR